MKIGQDQNDLATEDDRMIWNRNLMTAGLVLAATTGIANAQAPTPAQPGGAVAAPAHTAPAAGDHDRRSGDLPGPIDSLGDLQDTGRMVFKMADTNNDGQISQKEAIDAANLSIGGFFFRADANGDGVLSQDEARQARQDLMTQKPLLRYVAQQIRSDRNQNAGNAAGGNNAGTNPAAAIGNLLDANNDRQIQATEVRQAVQTAVQGLFAVADTNRDGQVSPTELNAAMIGAARSAAQAAFQQADADRNGSLSREEFDRAIVQPANVIFGILDANNDGQISPQEAQQARRIVGGQLQQLMVPEPANSARNLIRSGAAPDQVTPVPAVPVQAPAPTGAPR